MEQEYVLYNLRRALRSVVRLSKEAIKNMFSRRSPNLRMGSVERFVVREQWPGKDPSVRPPRTLGDFYSVFKDLVENDVPAVELTVKPLILPTTDIAVVERYGRKKLKTSMAHVFMFMETAKHYETYHFYVEDHKGVLWEVQIEWPLEGFDDGGVYGDEWEIEAYPFIDWQQRVRVIRGHIVYPRSFLGLWRR